MIFASNISEHLLLMIKYSDNFLVVNVGIGETSGQAFWIIADHKGQYKSIVILDHLYECLLCQNPTL